MSEWLFVFSVGIFLLAMALQLGLYVPSADGLGLYGQGMGLCRRASLSLSRSSSKHAQ